MTTLPLVSCIMPTRNRRQFVSQAVWYFLRQDYSPRELIILDDGEDALHDLVPNDERIRYIRLDHRMPLGAKRNLACQMSRGELIAHWDDDDWMAPQRLRTQVAELLAAGADVCGAQDVLYYRPHAGDAWRYCPPPGAGLRLAGGTLLYRRAAWAAHPFPETNLGEDSAFLRQFAADRVLSLTDSSFYIAVVHPGNTTARNLGDPCWQRRPLNEVLARLAPERDFYIALRQSGAPGPAPRPPPEAVNVAGSFMVYDGYGSMAEYLVLGLARTGVAVHAVPLRMDPAGLSDEFQAILARSHPDPHATTLCFCWPRENLAPFRAARDLFINTMWETSRLPDGWADILNQARAIIVPSRFVAGVFREAGVTVPVEVVPQGVDPVVYHDEARPERPGVTTLMVGVFTPRKNPEVGIAAWKEAFAGDPEARLIIKTRFKLRSYTPDDLRISFIDSEEPTRGIAHWYRQADVLLALGNEGFGLPLVEGMATGLPVIALNSEGQADVCAAAAECVLAVQPARWQAFDEAPFGPCGVRGIPAVADVAAHLRWVADHQEEARALGRAAAAWVHQHRNIWAMGPAMLDLMERHARPARPLRRCYTMWIAAAPGGAGVAQYAADLAAALPAVRVVTAPPDLRGVQLLHIQHEASQGDESALAGRVQQARYAAVLVAITAHSVTAAGYPWERDASVLIAVSAADAARLRARWPGKRVEVLPPGCPTWFPPRKRRAGRVVGVFAGGDPGAAHDLAAGVRAIPGAEPVLITAGPWGVDLARQLARELDLLVFRPADGATPAMRYAVRCALATGVPLLVPPAEAFLDLSAATYQPLDLLEGVRHLLGDAALRARLSAAAHAYCHEHSWPRTAEAHRALWRTLESSM